MADLPSGDGTAESSTSHLADESRDLDNQLINTQQQAADEGQDQRFQAAHAYNHDRGMPSSDNGAGDMDSEAKDGDDEWQELEEDNRSSGDERMSEGYDNEVKGHGVGEENPMPLCISPLGSYDYHGDTEDDSAEAQKDCNHVDLVFAPARTINFDDFDGDDLSALDQRLIPRGLFVQSDFLDDRPELHGSEGGVLFPGSSSRRVLHSSGDHSQNVRIIEGHDDLELDPRAGFVAMASRNNFLQTQVVHLPPFTADDHNASANLYDSLEREEGDIYLDEQEEEEDQQGEEDDAGCADRDIVSEEDGSSLRDAHPLFFDSHIMAANSQQQHHLQVADFSYNDPLRTSDKGDQGNGTAVCNESPASPPARSPSRDCQRSDNRLSPSRQSQEQQLSKNTNHHNSVSAGHNKSPRDPATGVSNGASPHLVSLPKPPPNTSSISVVGAEGGLYPDLARLDSQEPLNASRPKQPSNKGRTL